MEVRVTQPDSCHIQSVSSALSEHKTSRQSLLSLSSTPPPVLSPRRSSCKDYRETLRPSVKRTGSLQVHKDSKTTSNRYFRNLNPLGGNSSDSRLNISDKSRTISGTLDCQTARPPQVPKNEKFVRHGSARYYLIALNIQLVE